VAGRLVFCQGFSEPGAGSDLAALRTRAVPDGRGGWRVTGRKIWTSSATVADWIYLAARTGPDASRHRGITVFVLPMSSPGIAASAHDTIGGGQLGEVEFTDVPAPPDAVVGEVNGGWSVLMGTMDYERVTSEKVGVARWLVEHLEPHTDTVGQRKALLAIHGELDAARLLGLETLRMLEAGVPASAVASMCKLSIALVMQRLADLAVGILGPGALAEATAPEHERVLRGRVAAFYRAAAAATIAGGASDIQRTVIARRGLGLRSAAARAKAS
jgi:alkylation response protein AidB-like acyl-CoA dehydrogenase